MFFEKVAYAVALEDDKLQAAKMIIKTFFEMDSFYREAADKLNHYDEYFDAQNLLEIQFDKLKLHKFFDGYSSNNKLIDIYNITKYFHRVDSLIEAGKLTAETTDLSDADFFSTLNLSHTTRYNDPFIESQQWSEINTEKSACVFDFLNSTALLTHLSRDGVFEFSSDISIFDQYRSMLNTPMLLNQLIIFEKVYLNIHEFFKRYADLDKLYSYGIFREYITPPEYRFLDAYRLIKPISMQRITDMAKYVLLNAPFEHLWIRKNNIPFKNYDELMTWLYNEYAKDACGFESSELAIHPMMQQHLSIRLSDFMEQAMSAQGCLSIGNIPFFSSILKPVQNLKENSFKYNDLDYSNRDYVALFQIAQNNIFGYHFQINSFDDILRLREDKRIVKLRELINQYMLSMNVDESNVIDSMSKEIKTVAKTLEMLKFTDSPYYMFPVKALCYVPGFGTIVSVINDCLDLIKYLNRRKNGWVYLGRQ